VCLSGNHGFTGWLQSADDKWVHTPGEREADEILNESLSLILVSRNYSKAMLSDLHGYPYSRKASATHSLASRREFYRIGNNLDLPNHAIESPHLLWPYERLRSEELSRGFQFVWIDSYPAGTELEAFEVQLADLIQQVNERGQILLRIGKLQNLRSLPNLPLTEFLLSEVLPAGDRLETLFKMKRARRGEINHFGREPQPSAC
jgi:hypothetical protein